MVKPLSLIGLLVLAVAVLIGYLLDQTIDLEQTVERGAPYPYFGTVTNEELILWTDTVVRGELVSTSTSVTEHIFGDQSAQWSALLEFTFSVTEYLKNSGSTSTQVVAFLYQDGHDSAELARQYASWMASQHDTRWDDREAILFLYSTETTGRYILARMFKDGRDNYSLASDWQKVWLPAAQAPSGAGAREESDSTKPADPLFLLDVPGTGGGRAARSTASGSSTGTAPTISLSAFKQLVASVQAEIPAGASQDYRKCVELSYEEQRRLRHKIATEGTAVIRRDLGPVESGQPAGVVLWSQFTGARTQDNPGRHWFEGPDQDVVRFRAANFRPSPDSPGYVNFAQTIETARPLPAGEYQFFYNFRLWIQTICDKFSEIERNLFDGRLTVTRSTDIPRIQHEAFFDPVAIGSAVGADGANGVLKPNAFSLDGTTTTISSLKWESGTATMTLNPSASLAGYAVDFIALDGSVTSTLAFDDATQSGGTLTLSIATRPWNAGDKLMLRIRTKPSIAISGLDASIEAGRSDAFTVSASNLATTTSYTIRVTTDNADIGFDTTCADRQEDTSVPAASASHSAAFTLRACSATGGTVTATLMQGTTAVATATQDVTVTAPPPPPPHAPAPTGLSVATTTQTTIRVSWNTVQDAHRYKLERSADGSSGWSNVDDGISGTSHTLTGLSCATTVHFRVSARGDGSPYSTTFGSPSTSVSGTTGDCPPTPVATPTPTTTAPSPPVFASSTYSFTVAENASAFDAVGQVSAVDPDGGIVTYSIVAGNGEGKFNITHNDGLIVVRGSLDHDTTSSYTLTVRATDSSGATSTAVVNISVTEAP